MNSQKTILFLVVIFALTFTLQGTSKVTASSNQADGNRNTAGFEKLIAQAKQDGSVKIFVQFSIEPPYQQETYLKGKSQIDKQRKTIKDTQEIILTKLKNSKVKARYEFIPAMALDVDEEALLQLNSIPFISVIEEREIGHAFLGSSVPWIKADRAFLSGVKGTGYTIAILDSGIQSAHPTFRNGSGQSRVVYEACYSNDDIFSIDSLCPNGSTNQTGSGAASATTAACLSSTGDHELNGNLCYHGTHVAGIAAGNDSTYRGVAPDANIIAMQVFYRENEFLGAGCDGAGPCILYDEADLVSALQQVYSLRSTYNIASVNLSLGTTTGYSSTCDSQKTSIYNAISNLVNAGIAVIAASGNESYTNQMSAPACLSNVVSVAATNSYNDGYPNWNSTASMLDLFAPGVNIYSSVPSNNWWILSGTSMATPHVSGTWALLKQLKPSATYSQIFSTLTSTGPLVTQNGVARHRIDLLEASSVLAPVSPDLVSVSGIPSSVNLGQSFNITITARNTQGISIEGAINASILYSDLTDNLNITNPSTNWSADSLVNYSNGQGPIFNNSCSNIGNAVDHLVEAADFNWGPNESHGLTFTVTPNKAGTIWLRVRTTMQAKSGCNYANDTSVTGGTTDTDQQGWGVIRFPVVVNKATSTTTIASDTPDPSFVKQSYTVNVTVSGSYGAPTGTVNISDGSASCTATLSGGSGSCVLSSTSSGSKTLTASYSGDGTYNTSSDTEPHTVNKAPSTTTITSDSPDPSAIGQSYSVNVTVSGSYGTPTGTVSISDGIASCTANLSSGSGSCALTSTSMGSKTLTANYSGDSTYNPSSDTESHTVNAGSGNTSTTTITSDIPDPSNVNQTYTVYVTVTGSVGTPTGSVNISDGSASCTATLSGGSGSCPLTSTTVGNKTLTATYSGDSTYSSSNDTEPHVVSPGSGNISTTTITNDSPDPSNVNQSYTVYVTVSGSYGTPTGSVNISDGSMNCTATLSGGSGSCALTSTTTGSKTLSATYSGDGTYNSSSDTEPHTVIPGSGNTSTTTITGDSPDPSTVNQSYTVYVTVNGSYGTPTGTVNISDGNASCTAYLSGGSGSCALASPTAGVLNLIATYSGDGTYNSSIDTEPHTVNLGGGNTSTTTITSDSPDPSSVNQSYTVNVTVSGSYGTPTGTVNVSDGSASCTATLSGGFGSCTLISTSPGTKTLTATYSGNVTYNSSSDTESHTVILSDPLFNDDFNNAVIISNVPYTNTQDITSATNASDGSDPFFPPTGTCPSTSQQRYHTVWYRYTPPSSGVLSVDTNGSAYDTLLGIWVGARGALTSVGCDDDSGDGLQSSLHVSVNANQTYYIEVASFSSVDVGDLTLHVNFVGGGTFGDVPPSHMFYSYIEAFYNAGITSGCSTSPAMFCPDNPVTRGQMAVFIEKALGNLSPSPWPTGMFSDVSANDPFKPFIEQFYNDGITTGCAVSPLRYCPNNSVNRGEMAVFVEKALGNLSPNPFPTNMFADVLPGNPFKPFIEEFYNDGITSGCLTNPLRYCPASPVTRGQMAVFLVKAFNIPLP